MADEEKDFFDKLDEKMDNYKFTSVGQGIYNLGGILTFVLAIVCLVAWIKEGMSFWNIVGCEFLLLVICGLIVGGVALVIDVIIKVLSKL